MIFFILSEVRLPTKSPVSIQTTTRPATAAGMKNKVAKSETLIPNINGRLIIAIMKFSKFYILYSNKALEGTGLMQIEEFGILAIIYNKKNPIKSEVIYDNLLELSSGANMLIRLKKRGLISESADKDDLRAKRLTLTRKGEESLKKAFHQVVNVEQMMTLGMSEEDKLSCIRALIPVNDRYSAIFQKQKTKSFKEVYQENMH
jgi:DNA-binding MarR family transcriptional regulator